MFKSSLSNPWVFWIIISALTIFILLFNTNNLTKPIKINDSKIIEEQSLSKNNNTKDKYIIDLDKIESAKNEKDFIVKKDIEELSFSKKIESIASSENLFTILYGAIVSFLFVYREKQNREKINKLEKVEDELSIQLAKKNTKVYKDISKELELYANLIKNDLNLEMIDLNQRIENEPKYIVISSKNIIEQLVTKMYKKYLNSENENLNIMLISLHKNRTLNHNMHNYAQIIKAFGNKANHTSKIFDSREATLCISNLIEFLKELDNKNLLKEIDV